MSRILSDHDTAICLDGELSYTLPVVNGIPHLACTLYPLVGEAEMVVHTPAECCQQLVGTDGDPGHGVEAMDTPIESEDPNSSKIPHVHLGSMN